MRERVAEEVVAALEGSPRVGEWEVFFPILTVDGDGYPHVCLLSRAELAADEYHVFAVVASGTTIENIRRDGRATLVVFGPGSGTYCKLLAVATATEGGALGATFEVTWSKRDSIGIPLRGSDLLRRRIVDPQ